MAEISHTGYIAKDRLAANLTVLGSERGPAIAEAADATTGAQTLTIARLQGGVIDCDPAGSVAFTTDTAANIVAAGYGVGESLECWIHNNATAASGEVVTIAAGAGVTLHGTDATLTEGANAIGILKIVVRSSTTCDAYFFTGDL